VLFFFKFQVTVLLKYHDHSYIRTSSQMNVEFRLQVIFQALMNVIYGL